MSLSDAEVKVSLHQLIQRRGVFRRKITLILKKLTQLSVDNQLSETFYRQQKSIVNEFLNDISKLDCDIAIANQDVYKSDPSAEIKDEEDAAEYTFEVQFELDSICHKSTSSENIDSKIEQLNSSVKEMSVSMKKHSELSAPPLKCGSFDGSQDFRTFIALFDNCIGDRIDLSDRVKFAYLRSYLKGYAEKIVQHLSVIDGSYSAAREILFKEFHDVNAIIDDLITKLLDLKLTKIDKEFSSVKLFVSDFKSILYDLKSQNLDFFVENSAGNVMVSHILYLRLPEELKAELAHHLNDNYPSISDIFSSVNDCIKTLQRTRSKSDFNPDYVRKFGKSSNNFEGSKRFSAPALQNFNVRAGCSSSPENRLSHSNSKIIRSVSVKEVRKPCKLCGQCSHWMRDCDKYPLISDRVRRCNQLSLCSFCTSNKHVSDRCPANAGRVHLSVPCSTCKQTTHVSALCRSLLQQQELQDVSASNWCMTSSGDASLFLLPSITILVGVGKSRTPVRFLLDTGSQKSYISSAILHRIRYSAENMCDVTYNLKTFHASSEVKLKQAVLDLVFPNTMLQVPLLIHSNLSIQFRVDGLMTALNNFQAANIQLADSSFSCQSNDTVCLEGLLGIDIMQYFVNMNLVPCLNGVAFSLPGGVVPFGNIEQYLSPEQFQSSVPQSIERTDCNLQTVVNHVMEPQPSYFDPLSAVLPDSDVERGLERMFSMESIGLESGLNTDAKTLAYEKFVKGVSFLDGHYQVELPWNDDISFVPSNREICLKVLRRNWNLLQSKGLLKAYQNVFDQQEKEGIIERIPIPSEDSGFVFVPHRAVVKQTVQSTTKVRPVFNCSLRSSGQPSLNDAAFVGENLLEEMFSLLLRFRCHRFVILADIKQAFLQIRLKSEEDKNRFCFFWYENGTLVAYRYNSLVFGFTTSPFILNYILRLHASRYPNDFCSQTLSNSFYVDNLIASSDDVSLLRELYEVSRSRMSEGGFELRSWTCNELGLREEMERDGTSVNHQSMEELVLGYRYDVCSDVMYLNFASFDSEAHTKRGILSQISKQFDPLGLFLPVTIGGRILMRDIWLSDVSWDDDLPQCILDKWKSLLLELSRLDSIGIARCSVQKSDYNNLYVFCDASASAYGFVVYSFDGNYARLLFAKSKVAPKKGKTIPALELSSVVLAMKCLPSILSSLRDIQFRDICIGVDSQIVLSWMLSKQPRTKSLFVKNRISDVCALEEKICNFIQGQLSYNYVDTSSNPADLVTRGVTVSTFMNKLSFWLSGPDWLTEHPAKWPSTGLECVSEAQKASVDCVVNQSIGSSLPSLPDTEYVIDPKTFNSFDHLLRVTTLVFRFVCKLRKSSADAEKRARVYLLQQMQKLYFSDELLYLLSLNELSETAKMPAVPRRVENLNLFLDPDNLIRSRGRIAKCNVYNYDQTNPILVSSDSYMCELLIWKSHLSCQHLGLQSTVNHLRRSGVWIPRARSAVKKVISGCMICRKFNNFCFAYPKMTNLPSHRTQLVVPFQHVGVDYTSHLWVIDEQGNRTKMYILIYTCLNVRAVHLDLVPSMSTQDFLFSFKRFSNRFGTPLILYSDNALSFTAGGRVLQKCLKSSEFLSFRQSSNLKHIQIPLYSAWIGSTWERMIRTVKSCLFKVVGRNSLSYFELLTTLSDIEHAVNSRPLTYRSSEEQLEPITPNSFLRVNPHTRLIIGDAEPWSSSPNSEELQRSLGVQEDRIERFKRLWYDEYLLCLREHSRNLHQVSWSNCVSVGDIVIIKTPNKTRPFWNLGRVVELIVGYDGNIRAVRVMKGDRSIGLHSIRNLYPLELSITHSGEWANDIPANSNKGENDVAQCNADVKTVTSDERKPVRQAARNCRDFIRRNRRFL